MTTMNSDESRPATPNDVAKLLVQWAEAQAHADLLKSLITQAVLALGESVQAGNLRATYNRGRTSYDYRAAVLASPTTLDLVEREYLGVTNLADRVFKRAWDEEYASPPRDFADHAPPSVTLKVLDR